MELPTTPSPEHVAFDEMCAEVGEFDTLPEVPTVSGEAAQNGERESSFDGQILAGLVSPF